MKKDNYNSDIFRDVKEAVSMQQAIEYCGIKVKKGRCNCPFHQDKNPSLSIHPDGKRFCCFTCGAGGDQIKFVALYQGIRNIEAAKALAAAFGVPVNEPITYRERREAEIARKKYRDHVVFAKRSIMYLTAYRGLLCEAIHDQNPKHFTEALRNITYVEYLIECLQSCPEEVKQDKKAVKIIGEVEGRINNWHIRIEADGTISR